MNIQLPEGFLVERDEQSQIMSFLKGFLRGDPAKSAAKHERRAKEYQQEDKVGRAAGEWIEAGREYAKLPDTRRARECYLQAAQLFFADDNVAGEERAIRTASDYALADKDYSGAVTIINGLTRLGTRIKDDQLLLHALALKTAALIAANDLAKAKETHREALKIKKRLGREKAKISLFLITQALVDRFVDGVPISATTLLDRTGDSEAIDQLVKRLVTLYDNSQDIKLSIILNKETAKIREPVGGKFKLYSPIALRVVRAELIHPANLALTQPIEVPLEERKKISADFTLEARLPGDYVVGPILTVLEIDKQQFQLKTNEVPLRIAAAKPRIRLMANYPAEIHVEEEFEFLLRVDNLSHGNASDVRIRINLPPSVILKTGTLEKRIITLPAGQFIQFPLFLIISEVGTNQGRIEAKYLDPNGRSHRTAHKFTITSKARPRKPKD